MSELLSVWGSYWAFTAAGVTVLAWNAKAGADLRERRSARAALAFARDVVVMSAVLVGGLALVTEGRGCAAPSMCPCENGDVSCIERYCR